jgi:hypothetical protein
MIDKMKRERGRGTASIGWSVVALTMIVLLVANCGPGTDATGTPLAQTREPFTARRESADGAIVEWGGYTGGYEPGAEEEFSITIKNETEETWQGRFCLQLLDRQMPQVITTLEQRPFTLEPGVGFSNQITVQFPDNLSEGAYGLSLAVRREGGPMVDLVPVQVGESDEVRRATTQQDMDASLAACPPVASADQEAGPQVEGAKADLAQRLGIQPSAIDVQSVSEAEFPDASLGVPEPGKVYAQVLTPGYVIRLVVEGQTYEYHASDDRLVFVPQEEGAPQGSITIEGVQVTAGEQVVVHGQSTLPGGTCLGSELWADGERQTWWPGDACVPVEGGTWQMTVRLGVGDVPSDLDRSAQYMLRVYQQNGPDIAAVFAFDLGGPPTPNP